MTKEMMNVKLIILDSVFTCTKETFASHRSGCDVVKGQLRLINAQFHYGEDDHPTAADYDTKATS